MSQRLKLILTAVLSVIVTFFATSYLVRNSMLNAMSTKFVETEAFNDVGRLEFYDTLHELLVKGCTKEALEFVQIQQSLLLSGLKRHMSWGDEVTKTINDRNQEIARRAADFSTPISGFVIPTCK